MYKKICTPIVQYKPKQDGIDIYDISIVNHKDIRINLFHSPDRENSMDFPTIHESYGFIKAVLNSAGYKPKLINNKYNIQWVNLDNYRIETHY